ASGAADPGTDPAGQTAAVLPGVGGAGDVSDGGRPPAVRHALGPGDLDAGATDGLAVPGGGEYVAGGDGAGAAGRGTCANRGSGGAVRSSAGPGAGSGGWLRPAARDDARTDAETDPGDAAGLGPGRLSRTAQRLGELYPEPADRRAGVRSAGGVR